MQSHYTPYEVACHNTPADCYVSLLGAVYDVTRLIRDHPGPLIEPILAAAGKDISHWFDAATGSVRCHVDPETNLLVPYCPQDEAVWSVGLMEYSNAGLTTLTQGMFLHVERIEPTTSFDCTTQVPWWRDATLRVGLLSNRTRMVRIKNVLTEQQDTLEVPEEETLVQLQKRYLAINAHAASYTWKALVKSGTCGQLEFRELNMNQTLHENGVFDESNTFESLDLPSDFHIPVLHVYWNDDLTVA